MSENIGLSVFKYLACEEPRVNFNLADLDDLCPREPPYDTLSLHFRLLVEN